MLILTKSEMYLVFTDAIIDETEINLYHQGIKINFIFSRQNGKCQHAQNTNWDIIQQIKGKYGGRKKGLTLVNGTSGSISGKSRNISL